MSKQKIEESFLQYVKNLNKINDVEPSLSGNIDEIMKEPERWAEEQAERIISENIDRFLDAKKEGKDFLDAIKTKEKDI